MCEDIPFFINSLLHIGQAALLSCLGLWGSGSVSSKVAVSSSMVLRRADLVDLVDLVDRTSKSADLTDGFGHNES